MTPRRSTGASTTRSRSATSTAPTSVSTRYARARGQGAPPKSAKPRNANAPNAPKSAAWLLPTTSRRNANVSGATIATRSALLEGEVPGILREPHPRPQVGQPVGSGAGETRDDGSERLDLVVADHDVAHAPALATLDERVADLVDGAEQRDSRTQRLVGA